jgi:hypothetical protein
MSTGKDLIFLISQPRAGSTLLQRILGGHAEIHTVSEPWIALHPLFALRAQGASADYSHTLAREATLGYISRLPGGEETYIQSVRLMLNHLYDAALSSSGKTIFLDKTPRYYFIIPELRRVFPDARFIFLLRNPLAVLCSILEAWVKKPYFSQRYAFRNDLVHDLLTAPELLTAAIEVPGPNDFVVHYEHLVQSPGPTIARLCEQFQLDFDPRMIEYGHPRRNPERWPYGDQGTVYAEKRPVTLRAERWQQVLRTSAAWNELARVYLGALGAGRVEQLGYDFDVLSTTLGTPDGHELAGFLETAVLTPAFGESRDYLSQLAVFQQAIERAATLRKPLARAAGQQ